MTHCEAKPTVVAFDDQKDEEACKLAVVYRCQFKWEDLQPTEHDQVRYCTSCSQPVFTVSDREGFKRAVAAGRCVMVKDVNGPTLFVGVPAYPYKTEGPLKWDD